MLFGIYIFHCLYISQFFKCFRLALRGRVYRLRRHCHAVQGTGHHGHCCLCCVRTLRCSEGKDMLIYIRYKCKHILIYLIKYYFSHCGAPIQCLILQKQGSCEFDPTRGNQLRAMSTHNGRIPMESGERDTSICGIFFVYCIKIVLSYACHNLSFIFNILLNY